MKTICILVTDPNSLLSHSLKTLLESDSNVTVLPNLQAGPQSWVAAAALSQPDVVMFDRQTAEFNPTAITQLLMEHPNLRVIVVSDVSNQLVVLHNEEVLLTQSTDLLHLIHAF